MKTTDALTAIKSTENGLHGGGVSLPPQFPFDLLLGAPTALSSVDPPIDKRSDQRSGNSLAVRRQERRLDSATSRRSENSRAMSRESDDDLPPGDAPLSAGAEPTPEDDAEENAPEVTAVTWTVPPIPVKPNAAQPPVPQDGSPPDSTVETVVEEAAISAADAPLPAAAETAKPGAAVPLATADGTVMEPAIAAVAGETLNDAATVAASFDVQQDGAMPAAEMVQPGSEAAVDLSPAQADEPNLIASHEDQAAAETQSQHSVASSDTAEPSQPDLAAANAVELTSDKTPDANPPVQAAEPQAAPLQHQTQPGAPPAMAALSDGSTRPLPAALSRGESEMHRAAKPVEVDSTRLLHRVARAFHAAQQRGGEIKLRLNPPELGSLRLELRIDDGALTARLETETSTARTAIVENLPALRDRLAEQGIRIERFDVDLMQQQGQGAEARDQQPEWERGRMGEWENGRNPQPLAETTHPLSPSPSHPLAVTSTGLNVLI